MLNTKQVNTNVINTNIRLNFIKLGTLDQFIADNYQQMLQIYSDSLKYASDTDFSIEVWLTSNGRIANPYTEDPETFGYAELPCDNYKKLGWAESDIITDLLTQYYQKCQAKISEQKLLDGEAISQTYIHGTGMFTAKEYTDYIIASLDTINVSSININNLADAKDYSLRNFLGKLAGYNVIKPNLYNMLTNYCLCYVPQTFMPDKKMYSFSMYLISLIKLLQTNTFKPMFINELQNKELFIYFNLVKLLRFFDKTITLPINALCVYGQQDGKLPPKRNIIFAMQNMADFKLFLKYIEITNKGNLPVNNFLRNEHVIVQLKGNKKHLINELIDTLKQRNVDIDAINLLINFLSN